MTDTYHWTPNSFSRLYSKHYRALALYALNFTTDVAEAEDIVQDVFSAVWESDLLFACDAAVKSFLYTSVRNKSLDRLKHRNVADSYVQRMRELYPEPSFDDSADVLRRETIYEHLFHTIDTLPPRQREIFLLCMQGKKLREIADALQISAETVKTQKRRAMEQLRHKLSDEELSLLLILSIRLMSH